MGDFPDLQKGRFDGLIVMRTVFSKHNRGCQCIIIIIKRDFSGGLIYGS